MQIMGIWDREFRIYIADGRMKLIKNLLYVYKDIK